MKYFTGNPLPKGVTEGGTHLQAARDAEAAQVGAPLVDLPRERHVVGVGVPEELQHLNRHGSVCILVRTRVNVMLLG